ATRAHLAAASGRLADVGQLHQDQPGGVKQDAADERGVVASSSRATALLLAWPARWSSTMETPVNTTASRRYSTPSSHPAWSGIASIPEATSTGSDTATNSNPSSAAHAPRITTAKSVQPLNAAHRSQCSHRADILPVERNAGYDSRGASAGMPADGLPP